MAGFDRIELAYYRRKEPGRPVREVLSSESLGAEQFLRSGGKLGYSDLATAGSRQVTGTSPPRDEGTAGSVLWPEDYGETETYRLYGDSTESGSRLNIVVVPDGYTHSEKALMESDAANLVAYLRYWRPFAEHDRFINYVLVYAYSVDRGTDECDCGVIRDTAMDSRKTSPDVDCSRTGASTTIPDAIRTQPATSRRRSCVPRLQTEPS